MTQTLYVDPGHRIPDEDWARVVRRAEEIAKAAAENKTGGASPIAAPVLDMRGRSNKHSGVSGIATQLLVLHSAECPLRGGYAQSLTEWAITSTVVASWHRFVDPIARVYMMDDSVAAWHASEANPMSIGWEQAGYARYSRAEWMTPDGLLQLNSLAYDMAQVALRDGIPPVWLTTDQVTAITTHGDRTTKGFCLHRQIDPETRTDPGDAYPYELLMATIRQFMNPNAASNQEDFLMALSQEQQDRILAAADRINGRDVQRWMGPDNQVSDSWKEGWHPVRSTDLHDVLALHQLAHDNTSRILDAVRNIPGVDPAAIDRLGEELATQLQDQIKGLRITLVNEDGAAGE